MQKEGAIVCEHLLCWHFLKGYTHWDRHGERPEFTIHRTSCPNDDTPDGTKTMIDDIITGHVVGDGKMDDFTYEKIHACPSKLHTLPKETYKLVTMSKMRYLSMEAEEVPNIGIMDK